MNKEFDDLRDNLRTTGWTNGTADPRVEEYFQKIVDQKLLKTFVKRLLMTMVDVERSGYYKKPSLYDLRNRSDYCGWTPQRNVQTKVLVYVENNSYDHSEALELDPIQIIQFLAQHGCWDRVVQLRSYGVEIPSCVDIPRFPEKTMDFISKSNYGRTPVWMQFEQITFYRPIPVYNVYNSQFSWAIEYMPVPDREDLKIKFYILIMELSKEEVPPKVWPMGKFEMSRKGTRGADMGGYGGPTHLINAPEGVMIRAPPLEFLDFDEGNYDAERLSATSVWLPGKTGTIFLEMYTRLYTYLMTNEPIDILAKLEGAL